MRRVYRPGRCDDCGQCRDVTRVTFWVNGFQMTLCPPCVRPYRKVLLKPSAPTGTYHVYLLEGPNADGETWGRDFGVDYTRADALQAAAEYRRMWPAHRYYARKISDLEVASNARATA